MSSQPDPTTAVSALDAVERAFTLMATGPAPLAVDGAAIGHGLPRRLIDLAELRRVLLDRGTPAAARDAAWRVLVHNAQTRDASWTLAATGVALYGLRNAAGELAASYHGDIADLDAEVLAGFTKALRSIDPDAGCLPRRLIRSARKAGARARAAEWDYAARHIPVRDSLAPPRPAGHEDLVLARAVAEGALTEWQANLIYATRLEKTHLTDIARHIGCTYRQICYAREKAENALLEWLGIGPEERKHTTERESAA